MFNFSAERRHLFLFFVRYVSRAHFPNAVDLAYFTSFQSQRVTIPRNGRVQLSCPYHATTDDDEISLYVDERVPCALIYLKILPRSRHTLPSDNTSTGTCRSKSSQDREDRQVKIRFHVQRGGLLGN